MARTKPRRRTRLKLVVTMALTLAGGIALLMLSLRIRPEISPPPKPVAGAPATAPSTNPPAPHKPTRDEAFAGSASNLLLLFSTACFMILIVCIGWLVVDIRNSRPAWQRNPKFPRKR